jgi:hypothetical protein
MKPRILRIRLVCAQPIGRNGEVEHHLSYDSRIDGVNPVLTFDKDPRFIRMDFPGKDYFDLIPISNIATMHMEPGKPEPT